MCIVHLVPLLHQQNRSNMNNPFEIIETRLNSIEKLLLDLKDSPKSVIFTEQPDEFLTIKQFSWRTHLREATIYTKVSRGEIPGVFKQGGRLYFSKKSLDEWIKSGKKKSNMEIEAEAKAYLKNGGK